MRFQSDFLPGSACQSTPWSNRSVNWFIYYNMQIWLTGKRTEGFIFCPFCNYSSLNSLSQNVWNLSRNLLVLSFWGFEKISSGVPSSIILPSSIIQECLGILAARCASCNCMTYCYCAPLQSCRRLYQLGDWLPPLISACFSPPIGRHWKSGRKIIYLI